MKQLIRILIGEISFTILLGITLAILLLNKPEIRPVSEAIEISNRPATEVSSVIIENDTGILSVNMKDGGYVIDGIPAEQADTKLFIELLNACSRITAQQCTEYEDVDLAKYGLQQPTAQMTAVYKSGESLKLQIGGQESISGDYYCTVEGEKKIFLIQKENAEWYFIARESLISLDITPKMEVSSALTAIQDVTFSGKALEEPVIIKSVSAGDENIKQTARSFGAATHIIQGAGTYELDQTYALTILTPLCGMRGDSVVSYGLSESQIEKMGFGDPYMRIEFDYKNGPENTNHYILRFLPAADDGSCFYVNVKGSNVVYSIKRPVFMDVQYQKLIVRWFLSPLLMDVKGVTVENSSKKYEFKIDNTDVRNPVITLNDTEVDTDLFRLFYKLLGSAANDGEYLGVQSKQSTNPLLTITYRYTGEKPDDVMELYAGEARRMNVYINDVCEFAMKDTFAERVNQAIDALMAGKSFDISW